MALSPIQIFQNPSTQGLLGILSGSSNALTMGLQSAIQIGRDLSNKAVQQERDFLRERRSEIELAYRRGENVRDQFNTDRNFSRMTANDLFSQGMQRDQFAEVQEQNDFSQEMSEDRFKLDQQQEQRMGTESKFRMDEVERDAEFNRGLLTPRDIFGPQLPKEEDPFTLEAEAELKIEAARAARNPEALRAATREKAQAERIMAERRAAGTEGGVTPAEARAARSEQRTLTKAEEAKREKKAAELIADTEAFAPQSQFLEVDKATNTFKDVAALEAAKLWDKDRLGSERAAATAVSREEYVSKGGNLPDAKKKRRGEFWDLVNGGSTAAPAESSPSTPATAGSYVRDAAKALE